jgi:hypothetical protein
MQFFETPKLDKDWEDEGKMILKEHFHFFVRELYKKVREEGLDPEEAAADILVSRGWHVFTEYAYKQRVMELLELKERP